MLNLRLAIRDTKLFFYRKMQSYRIAQLGIMADNHNILNVRTNQQNVSSYE